MRRSKASEALEGRVILKLEGLGYHKLLSECLEKKIYVKNVQYLNELEIELTVSSKDYGRLKQLARNRFILTECKKEGVKTVLSQIFSRKSFLVGFGLFLFLILYQSQFVSEINITGLKTIPREEVIQILERNGLFVGSHTDIDKTELESRIYEQSGGKITWVNVEITGTKAEIEVVESNTILAQFDYKKPCDIVAKKDGYIMNYVAKTGQPLVKEGQSVTKGQRLIAGTRTLAADEGQAGETTEKFHAIGDVYAKVFYYFHVNQERYEIVKKETGRRRLAIRVQLGDFMWNSYYLHHFLGYDRAKEERYTLFHVVFGENPEGENLKIFGGRTRTPIVIELLNYKEITAEKRERTEEEIAVHMKKIVRDRLKDEMPPSAIILKQELRYDATPGTVKVTVDLQTMEQIGIEKAI